MGSLTNIDGVYSINCKTGKYTLVVSFIGYKNVTKEINIKNGETLKFNFILKEDSYQLDDIVLKGKTKAEKLREESYAVEVIEAKVFKNLSVNANEILNKVPGVNIRQSGGLGEDAVLSLNGLTGSQVRVFIDGIPMEFFGSSLSLNNFPSNLIEQIEVYKGVVPIHLSSDALGGAVNLTTNKSDKSFLDASYSYGSFNTHIASLNAQFRDDKTGFTTRLKSFYNYSDNDYKIDVNIYDSTTGNYDDFTTEVKHFHDAYDSKMGWLEAGFTNTSFADDLMVGVMYSDNYDQVQQPETVIGDSEQPFGQVYETEKKLISTVNYSKNHLFTDALSFNSYLVYVDSEYRYKNISEYVYDWFGDRTFEDDGTGEGDKRQTDLILDSKNILGNFNLDYSLSETSNLAFNYNISFLDLKGEDPYNTENNTRFSNPISFNKQVLASSYTHSFLDKKLKTTVFAKYYKYNQTSTDTNYSGDELIDTSTDYNHIGYGLAASYFLNNFQFKGSFEHAVRFPDVIELYGDGVGYDANPYLVPETTNNFNIGSIYKTGFDKSDLMLSVNGFIRDSKDFIFAQKGPTSIYYENLDNVFTSGVDFSTNYNYNNKIILNIAGTYINQINNQETIAGGVNSLYKERVPNEPYLYGNVSLSYNKENLLNKEDNFSVTVNQNYVHEFYYKWGNLGFSNTKYVIPSQITTDLDFVYSLKKQKYNFSFGILNAFNVVTYDNLYQQNPRRSMNFKFRYFINYNKSKKMKKKVNFSLKMSVIALSSLLFIQCSSDDSVSESTGDYYVGIEYGSDGADYLSLAENLAEGTVSPVGNGFEQLGWASYIQGVDQIFSNVGSTLTSYEKDVDGVLTEGSSVTTSLAIYAYDVVDESTIVAMGSPWFSTGNKDIYVIDTDAMTIKSTVETEFFNYTDSDTGEQIFSMPSGAKVIGDYLFISYYLVDSNELIVDENEAKVAIYSYPELELQSTITDDRIADIGRYYSEYAMIEDENSDIYVMSSSSLACGWYPIPTVNSGILKINNGDTDFDDDYYLDFETLSGGYKLNDIYYAENGKAVVRFVKDDSTAWSVYNAYSEDPVLGFGVLDLYNGTFTDLSTGDVELSGGGWNGVSLVEGSTVYVGVSNSAYSGVYVIDVDAETITEGADIDGNYAKALLAL